MSESGEQERHVRRFLLGQLEEDEWQRVEKNVILNAGYREQILIAEERLIEDYVDGILPVDEVKAFETHFATARQLRKIIIAELLSAYDSPKVSDSAKPTSSSLDHSTGWFINRILRNRPALFAVVGVALFLLVTLGVSQIIRERKESNEQIEATKRDQQLERELAQLNSTPSPNLNTLSLALLPVTLRDASEASTLRLPLTAQVIEVRLILAGSSYSSYSVELTRMESPEKYNINELREQSTTNGEAVVVRIPSRMLERGDYKLSLFGELNGGGVVPLVSIIFGLAHKVRSQ